MNISLNDKTGKSSKSGKSVKIDKKITDKGNKHRLNTKSSSIGTSLYMSERSAILNQDSAFMFVDKTVTAFKFKGSDPILKG